MTTSLETAEAETTRQNRWWVVIAAGLSLFMVQLDALTVSTALPTIEERLHTTPGIAQWVMLGLTVPAIALLFPAGRWLHRVGQRPALLVTVAGFVGVGALAALSPNIGWLIAARIVQGGFGAVLFVLMPLLVTAAVAAPMRGRAMGIMFTLGPLGGVVGPGLGGTLVDHVGWQAIFLINVPVAVTVLAIAVVAMPRTVPLARPDRGMLAESSALLAATAVILVALTLAAEQHPAWLVLIAVAAPVVLNWLRQPSGRAVRALWRVPDVRAPLIALWAQTTGQIVLMFMIPFYLRDELDAGSAATGLIMVVLAAGMMTASPIAGWLTDTWGARRTAALGMAVLTTGFATAIRLDPGWSTIDVAWRMGIVGIGIGLFAGAQTAMAMAAAPAELSESASAAISLARQIGIGTGPALATMVWALSGYDLTGMRLAIVLVTMCGLTGFLALARPRAQRQVIPA